MTISHQIQCLLPECLSLLFRLQTLSNLSLLLQILILLDKVIVILEIDLEQCSHETKALLLANTELLSLAKLLNIDISLQRFVVPILLNKQEDLLFEHPSILNLVQQYRRIVLSLFVKETLQLLSLVSKLILLCLRHCLNRWWLEAEKTVYIELSEHRVVSVRHVTVLRY
jgi:hypothetical protein